MPLPSVSFPAVNAPVGTRLVPSRLAGEPFNEVGYADFVRALNPVLWLRQRETVGTTAANSGSGGAALNGTISGATLGQAGLLGPADAFLFDGSSGAVRIINPTALYSLPAYTYACLMKASSAGENNRGTLGNWSGQDNQLLRFGDSLNALFAQVIASGGNATAVTTTGLAADTWAWLFHTYDDAGDRKIHLLKGGVAGVSEFAYASQVAASGTLTANNGDIYLGNRSSGDRTHNGLIDEQLLFNRVLSLSEMQRMVALTPFS